MIALYITGKEQVEFRDNTPVPKISKDKTLIKVQYAGICGSDVHNYRNGIDHFGGTPFILGPNSSAALPRLAIRITQTIGSEILSLYSHLIPAENVTLAAAVVPVFANLWSTVVSAKTEPMSSM